MNRDDYFDLCVKAAVKLGLSLRFQDVVWDDSDLVVSGGIKYVPTKYILGFDRNGNAVHTVELRDIMANYSVTIAKLSDVEMLKGE